MMLFGGNLQGALWHSHEMVFGFAVAVITGFLFTAVRNWTGLPTPTGAPLGLIALVWVAGRILPATGPEGLGSIVDLLFLPLVAIGIAIPIFRSSNRRNYKIVALVAALAILHFVLHLAHGGALPAWLSRSSTFAAMDIITILFAVVGGRVIPAFTRNAVPGSNPAHQQWLEVSAFGLLLILAVTTFAAGAGGAYLSSWTLVLPAFLAAAAHAFRLAYWQPAVTVSNPLLWMMPVAYSWLPVALLLRGLAGLAIVPPSAWIHALTAGAFASLMVAMMMRSTLGHTGRKLEASRADVFIFLMIQLAAVSRVLAGIAASHRTMTIIAGLIWIIAFAVFLARYLPMLVSSRVDGKPG
jgi:uncharacterized protein involved in response to NO